MAKKFGENERRLCALFKRNKVFKYNNVDYKVVIDADKPTCNKGEPKTDIFIETVNLSTDQKYDFKISYKQDNADFIENKTSAERAHLILGDDWMNIVTESTRKLSGAFENSKLIYKNNFRKTGEGAITLGWKFELLRVKSGLLSDEIGLSYDQKVDVYAGTNLPIEKRNAYVRGEVIENSGVAEYLLEEKVKALDIDDAVSQLKTIPEYLDEYPNLYYACKALNYRTFQKKYDGNRPLAVYVDWFVKDGKLAHEIVYENPLITRGNEVYARLAFALRQLGIETTDDITKDNVIDYEKIVYEE